MYHHRQLAIASGAVVIALNSVEHAAQFPSTMSVDEILTRLWALLSQVDILKCNGRMLKQLEHEMGACEER